jgi:hypothetical protein
MTLHKNRWNTTTLMLSNNQSIETMLLNVLKSMNLQKNVLQNIHVSELSRINEAECNYKQSFILLHVILEIFLFIFEITSFDCMMHYLQNVLNCQKTNITWFIKWRCDCLMPKEQLFNYITVRTNCIQWDNDDVCFVPDQHASYDFYSDILCTRPTCFIWFLVLSFVPDQHASYDFYSAILCTRPTCFIWFL